MPELPEVETIRRQLNDFIVGKIIKQVDVQLPKQIKGLSPNQFRKIVHGAKVIGLERRAKMLAIKIQSQLNDDWSHSLVFHLKMTGQLIYRDIKGKLSGGGHPMKGALEDLPNKYSHVFFTFKDNSKLFFNDLRQFGWVTIIKKHEPIENLSASKLGPEPLSKDFNFEQFFLCLNKRPNMNIYQAILDQRCVVGVGNIYVNESLHFAGIKPTRKIKDISKAELKLFYQGIKKIIKRAVEANGTTIGNYMDALGDIGGNSKYLKVYQRAGELCLNKCGLSISKVKIGGRSAFYCNECQN